MSLLANLRLIVYLRRIARALESLADSQAVLASRASQIEQRRAERAARKPRPVQLGVMDVEEVNKRYRERQAAEGIDT